MLLICNFEELQALSTGADLLMGAESYEPAGAIAAPPEAYAQVAMLQPRLQTSLEIGTLDEQRWVRKAVAAICNELHERMDGKVIEYHPAHEEAVAYYFDYAHAYGVLHRLDDMGAEMTALIELMTGDSPTIEAARGVNFSD